MQNERIFIMLAVYCVTTASLRYLYLYKCIIAASFELSQRVVNTVSDLGFSGPDSAHGLPGKMWKRKREKEQVSCFYLVPTVDSFVDVDPFFACFFVYDKK